MCAHRYWPFDLKTIKQEIKTEQILSFIKYQFVCDF